MHNEDFFNTIIDKKEYICGNSFIDISNGKDILFCKIDNVSEHYGKQIDTFITHNGDYSVDQNAYNIGPKCNKWYGQNKNINMEKVLSIPIGLENFEPEFSFKSNYGRYSTMPPMGYQKKEYISFLSSNCNEHKNLIYLNFNSTTFPTERNYVKSLFFNESWVTKENNVDWKIYYNSLINSKFCFSPRGNGIDCHRTWEALYLRTIPILKKEFYMEEFSDLPILFVDHWSQINEDFLNISYEQMIKKQYNLDKLKISFWKRHILNANN